MKSHFKHGCVILSLSLFFSADGVLQKKRRLLPQEHHPFEAPEFRMLNRQLESTWGCEPKKEGPQALQDAANYIANTMIPEMKKLKSYYTVEGTGGFVSWIDLVRGLNNPWCIVRGKTFTKWGKRLVKIMKTTDDSFDAGKKVPVVRNYIKKASFLEKFAEKIINVEDYLQEKCKTFEKFSNKVLEEILDKLSDAATIISILIFLVLPLFESAICGLNNMLAAFVVSFTSLNSYPGSDRHLRGSEDLFNPDMDISAVFGRVLDELDDPYLKSAMNDMINLNADRLRGKTVSDWLKQDLDRDYYDRQMISKNVTDIAQRFLSFNEESIVDLSSLKAAVGVVKEVNNAFATLDNAMKTVYDNVVPPAQAFVNTIVEPFEDIGKALQPFEPIIDVIGQIVGALSFLKCPEELGFICDLDEIIIGIVEDFLAELGLDINQIIDDAADGLSNLLGLPDISDIDLKLPELDIFNFDQFYEQYLKPFEQRVESLVESFLFNPVKVAFDKSGDIDLADTKIGGLEFRYSSSNGARTEVECATGKFPLVLSASRRTARCPNDIFTGKSTTPCGRKNANNGPCYVEGRNGLAACDISPPSSFFDIPGISSASIFNMVNVLYTCITEAQFQKLDLLPFLNQGDGGQLTCSPNEIIAIDDANIQEPCLVQSYRASNLLNCEIRDFLENNAINLSPNTNYYDHFTRYKRQRDANFRLYNDKSRVDREFPGDVAIICKRMGEGSKCRDGTTINFYKEYTGEPISSSSWVNGYTGKLGSYHNFREGSYKNTKTSVAASADSCVAAVQDDCEDKIRQCDYSNSCSNAQFLLLAYGCFVEGRDTSIPGTNVYTDVAFKEATGKLQAVNIDCSFQGGYIETVDVETGEGVVGRSVDFTKCNGLQTCSVRMAELPIDDQGSTLRVTAECRCSQSYYPLPTPSTGQCRKCDAGTYRNSSMSDCEPCPAGYISNPGSAQCTQCKAGSFAEGKGNKECVDCKPGTFSNLQGQGSSDACQQCALHTFNDSLGLQGCAPCPAGTEATELGSSSCSDVPYGTYSTPGSGALPCEPGSFSDVLGAQVCKDCMPGSYARGLGSAFCEACPLHTWTNSDGSSLCTPCPSGEVISRIGATSNICEAVPAPINYLDPIYDNFTCDEILLLDISLNKVEREEIAARRMNQIGNGFCNKGPWNTKQCDWDGGDCCIHTCTIPADTGDSISSSLLLRCTQGTFDCLDPNVAGNSFNPCTLRRLTGDALRTNSLSLSPARRVGDGFCDEDLNTQDYYYDGGDCCWQSCQKRRELPQSCLGPFDSCQDATAIDLNKPELVFPYVISDLTISVDKVPLPPQVSARDDNPCFDNAVNYNEVRTDGDCQNNYSLERTWNANDSFGNQATQTQKITVIDDTPPPLVDEKAYCIETEKKKKKQWVKLEFLTNGLFGYSQNEDVCGDTRKEYCNPSVESSFISCTSSHQVSAKDYDGTTDCFFSKESDELYLYVDTKDVNPKSTKNNKRSLKSDKKSHRLYTVLVQQLDLCGNIAATKQTFIIPNKGKELAAPDCDRSISFDKDDMFNLCSRESIRDGKCIRFTNLNGDSIECPKKWIKKEMRGGKWFCDTTSTHKSKKKSG